MALSKWEPERRFADRESAIAHARELRRNNPTNRKYRVRYNKGYGGYLVERQIFWRNR